MASENMTSKVMRSGNQRTPKGRLSYPYLLAPNPKAKTKDGKLKYTCSLVIPPGSDMTTMKLAAAECAKEKWGEKVTTMKLKSPFLDAEEKMGPEWKGWTVIRVSTTNQPGVVGPNNSPDGIEPKDIYPGRWAYLTLNPGDYDVDGNRGVSFFLNNVQLLDHDEPIAGRPRATDDFEAVAEDMSKESAGSIFG